MTSKSTKRALITSVLSILMCVAMLIGTTFAWFTDTASTGVNKIQAGTLDVALEMATEWNDDGTVKTWVNAEGRTLTWKKAAGAPADEQVLWEPGCTYELPELRIVNKGSLALKYKIQITGIQGNAKLNEVIDWTYTLADGSAFPITDEGHLTAGQDTGLITISGKMLDSAGNQYQGLSIDGIGITVVATQDNVEADSFGTDYDATAVYPAAPSIVKAVASGKVTNAADNTTVTDTASAVQATIPANTLAVGDNVVLTVERKAMTADSVTYDIDFKVNELTPTLLNPVSVNINIGAGLKDVVATHNGNAMTKVDNAVNDQEYSYNRETGILTIVTKTFSPFAIEYKTDFTAKIGNIGYATIADAFAAAKTGDTVIMLKDVDVADTLIVEKTVTLDMNGKKLYNSSNIWTDTDTVDKWSLISVRNSGNLTVTGDGIFEAKENDCYAIDLMDGAKCTIENGTFIGNIHAVYVFKGELTVNGGQYSVLQKYSAAQPDDFILNCYDANYHNETAKIIVNGGSFKTFDPSNNKAEGTGTNFVADGYSVIRETKDNGDVWYTVVKGTVVVPSTKDDMNNGITGSSNKDVTVVMPANSSFTLDNGIANGGDKSRDVTFVGDGSQTVDVAKNAPAAENAKHLNYQRGSTFTFENLTIENGTDTYDGIVCDELTYKNCTIKGVTTLYGKATFINCTFENNMANQYSIWTWGGTDVTFENCTFNTNGKAILLYGGASATNPTNLVVNNCTFNDRNNGAADKAAIEIGNDYNATYTLTVNNATVNGFAAGKNTGSTLWANKNSMDATHLTVTINGSKVQ